MAAAEDRIDLFNVELQPDGGLRVMNGRDAVERTIDPTARLDDDGPAFLPVNRKAGRVPYLELRFCPTNFKDLESET
jgi:hypothetical protein